MRCSCSDGSWWSEATVGELIRSAGLFVNGNWIETKDPDGEVRLIQLADTAMEHF